MEEKRGYAIFESKDEEYFLAPSTVGRYRKARALQLRCTAIPETVKELIRTEFNIGKEEEEAEESFGITELYRRYVGLMFLGAPEKFDLDDVNLGELNRAMRDFFGRAQGS